MEKIKMTHPIVELDGDEYEVKTADFTRNDGGKIRFTASFTA